MDPEPTQGNPPPATPASWYEGLSPELKVEKSLQNFKDKGINDFAKSWVEAQKMIGGSIRLPKPDAPPEEQERFYQDIYTKLGRPESPDKYDPKRPTLPDGTPWDAEGEKEFLATAHKHGLNPKQAQGLLDWYGGRLAQGMAARTAQYEETDRLLHKEWGQDYERKLTLAQQAAMEVGGKDFVALLEEKGLANHPLMLRTLAAYGETLAESKIISGDLPGQPTANEAQSRIDAIYANREDPYWKLPMEKQTQIMYELTKQATGAKGRQVVAQFG